MITKEEFFLYEELRKSGIVNMLDVFSVEKITELPQQKILEIMNNYSKLKDVYDK
jgi:hypothetical protein